MKEKLTYSTKSRAPSLGHKKGHGNPSSAHSSRGMSGVKRQKSSGAGLQGLSVGQKVPMEMFDQKYTAPNPHGMTKIQNANSIKKGTKKALGGSQRKFFGL